MVFLYPFVNWSKSLPFKLLEIEVFNNRITMTETVNQGNNTANETQEERTFTQSQLDAIIHAGCDLHFYNTHHHKMHISIHAPHAGCDLDDRRQLFCRNQNFNPRTPCGVRRMCSRICLSGQKFQSTHPMRGATRWRLVSQCFPDVFQSTHPMRGATTHGRCRRG